MKVNNKFLLGLIIGTVLSGAIFLQIHNAQSSFASQPKMKVVASFFPLYDFARNVAGDKAEVAILVPLPMEVHDWEPVAEDVVKLKVARVFIFNGGGIEPWVDNILLQADNPRLIVVNTSQDIPIISDQKGVRDPHLWLDPNIAKIQVLKIRDALMKADPENASTYLENAKVYIEKLTLLDAKIKNELAVFQKKEFIAFHKAFSYFAARYGLTQISILGTDPEQEPSAATIASIIQTARAANIKAVYTEKILDPRLAEVIASEIKGKLLILDPIESVAVKDYRDGVDYLYIMNENLVNLKQGLS